MATWPAAAAMFVAPLGVGLASSLVTGKNVKDAYEGQPRPPGSPPAWVFGPVWTFLYVLMGLSAAGYYLSTGSAAPWAFWAQLFLNFAWTPVFFAARMPWLALAILLAMLALTIYAAMYLFRAVPWTGLALVPYILWLLFAGYLNSYYAFRS